MKQPMSRQDTASKRSTLSRRALLQLGVATGVAAVGVRATASAAAAKGLPADAGQPFPLEEATLDDLQRQMAAGEESARSLTDRYLARIQALDPTLHAVLETNAEARAQADALDAERRAGSLRGPLHGVPVLLKDNIATAGGMHTTAGSLALLEATVAREAFVVTRLRSAGAVLLGKTNLSEWANLSFHPFIERVECAGGPVPKPIRSGPDPFGVQLWLRCCGRRQPVCRGGGDRDGRLHRLALGHLCAGGTQAHRRAGEPLRHHSHFAHPGHRWSHGPHGARRGPAPQRAGWL